MRTLIQSLYSIQIAYNNVFDLKIGSSKYYLYLSNFTLEYISFSFNLFLNVIRMIFIKILTAIFYSKKQI